MYVHSFTGIENDHWQGSYASLKTWKAMAFGNLDSRPGKYGIFGLNKEIDFLG